jgi:hypothetical protein
MTRLRIVQHLIPVEQKIAPRRRAGRCLRNKKEGATPLQRVDKHSQRMKDYLLRNASEYVCGDSDEAEAVIQRCVPMKSSRIIRPPFSAAQKIAPRRRAGRRLRNKKEGALPLPCIPVFWGRPLRRPFGY